MALTKPRYEACNYNPEPPRSWRILDTFRRMWIGQRYTSELGATIATRKMNERYERTLW